MATDDRVEQPQANSPRRVLVVDDEASNRELISDMLASEGYAVANRRKTAWTH